MTVTQVRPTFESYVLARSGALLRFAYVLCGDRHLAEDLVQEVLIRAHRRWSAIEAADPDGYLKQALVRTHISWRRRRSSTEVASAAIPDEGRAAGFDEAHASREELWALLDKLSAAQRCVLVLRYFEDLDDRRIAEIVGASPSTVRVHAHRGLAKLRELIATSDSAAALAQVSGLPDALTRRADDAPAARPGLVDSVRQGAAKAARRRRIAVGVAGAGLAALVALLLLLPNLWRSGHDIPPTEPTPTTSPSPLPTSSLRLVPVTRPADPTFPYIATWIPDGFETPIVTEFVPKETGLRLTYTRPDGLISASLTPGPYPFWDITDATVETTTVNGVPAELRYSPSVSSSDSGQGCIGVSWPRDGQWLTVGHCWYTSTHLSIEDVVRFAEGLAPGITLSTPQPPDEAPIAGVSLPPGFVVHQVDDWADTRLCASTAPGVLGICVSVEPMEPGTGTRSPLRIDGHPAIDWVNSSLFDGPRYVLTVYLGDYKIHVATTEEFTLGDRIAIYRSVVIKV